MERQKLLVWSNGKGYHYNFDCVICKKEYELITGDGRYGNLGPFECPNCHKEYYATIIIIFFELEVKAYVLG